jgi:hypothetical protein
LLAVVALIGFGTAYAMVPETSDGVFTKAYTNDPRPHDPVPDAGGETFADAVDMMALPFSDAGNLFDYADDIDFGYGTSPDVVYKYTPAADGCITVDGCGSQYDQMIFVVDEAMTIIAWNDDGMNCDAYQSQIAWMNVYAGVLYYYVLDGYGGGAGPYDLQVFERDCPPAPECPAGAIIEGEGCAAEYIDNYNGGCNSTPSIFSVVNCAGCPDSPQTIVICGTVFNYYTAGAGRRDTDWYLLEDLWEVAGTALHLTSYYESSGSLYIMRIDDPCAATIPAGIHIASRELGVLDFVTEPPAATVRWGVFQSKNYYDGTWFDCTDPESWPYVLTIDGYYCEECQVSEDNQTWGGVKNLFK